MSSFVAKMLFTVVTVAISGIAAYILSTQFNEAHSHGAPRRRRRSSTPRDPNNRWYGPPDDDDDDLVVVDETDCINEAPSASQSEVKTSCINACSICLEKYDEIRHKGKEIHSTLCGHIFCELCIRKATRRNPFCPQCRKSCPPGSTHAIYL